ncbi:hypothetical protein [Burkholderia alba]|uniref:hypothetical protein n=1 Tax=Burkholderia alba TaxID=2683677 RepID=UPI002B054E87|nr:hypothetical protein [Burkholderia alba]
MTNESGEMLSLRWTTGTAVPDGAWPRAAQALAAGGAIALAVEGDAPDLDGCAVDTLQRYLAFMSGMTVLRGDAGAAPGDSPALRVPRGTSADAIAEHARRAAAAGHEALVCIAARGDGETDLYETLDGLRDVPLRTVWLYDARDGEGDVAWTQALHRRCGRSLNGVAVAGGFEAALRACSHFIHGTRGHHER